MTMFVLFLLFFFLRTVFCFVKKRLEGVKSR